MLQRFEAGYVQRMEKLFRAHSRRELHRGDVVRAGERLTSAHRTAEAAIVVARVIRAGRRRVGFGNVGQHAGGGVAAVERQTIEERLERRPGLPRRDHHVGLPVVRRPEVRRADPGEHFTGLVVQNDGRGLLDAAVVQHVHSMPHLGLELRLEREVERRPNSAATVRRGGAVGEPRQHARREVGRAKGSRLRRRDEWLLASARDVAGCRVA